MAESTTKTKAPAEQEENGKPTRRVVLRHARVLVLPEGVDRARIAEAIKALRGASQAEGWIVVGEFEGASKTHAIEAYAGKPGTADAKPGSYRAPSVTAWKGQANYVKPPEPLIERELVD